MYKRKPLNPLQNEKCFACRFCVWDNERQEERCQIPKDGCIDNSHFIEYKGQYETKNKR